MKGMIRSRLLRYTAAAASSGDNGSGSKSKQPICSICGKSFMSVKALHGHMRCHPERDWRGMLPPPPLPKQIVITTTTPFSSASSAAPSLSASNATTLATDHVDDHRQQQQPLQSSGWVAKAKRVGKSSIQASCSSPHSTLSDATDSTASAAAERFTEDEEEAIISLLQLQASTSCLPPKKPRLAVRHQSAPLNPDNNNSESFGILCPEDYNVEPTELPVLLDQNKCNNAITVLASGQEERGKLSNEDHDRKEKMAAVTNNYRCEICNKAFNSYQALGGHKSSHFHKAKSPKAAEESAGIKVEQLGLMPRLGGNSHQCKVCNKSFESGQKLGGHMRCHWAPPAIAAPATAEKKPLDFDLNEFPAFDAEELRPQLATVQLFPPYSWVCDGPALCTAADKHN